jgi:hypothetical protein
MVVVKIHQDAPVEPELLAQAQSAPGEMLLLLGKGVDTPVQLDAAAQQGRVGVPQRPLNEIAHEVAGHDVRVVAGQIEME